MASRLYGPGRHQSFPVFRSFNAKGGVDGDKRVLFSCDQSSKKRAIGLALLPLPWWRDAIRSRIAIAVDLL
jgi:hypothetical protein